MAKGKKRAKAMAARRAQRASTFAGYKRPEGDVSDKTKYGKRVLARRRGEPMAARPVPPWWMRLPSFSSAFSE